MIGSVPSISGLISYRFAKSPWTILKAEGSGLNIQHLANLDYILPSRPGFGVFLGLVGGDDDAALEDEVETVADRFRAGELSGLRHQSLCIMSRALAATSFFC